ncbi:TPA: N-acetyltransferase family protein [Streptococcus agalactiae]
MIRRAKEKDLPDIAELLKQILMLHHEVRPDIFHTRGSKFSKEQLKEMLMDESRPIFVYESDEGKVVAHLFLQLQEKRDLPRKSFKTLYIDDLCIDEEVRGQQIGQKLIDFARQYAKKDGCYNITLNVWNDNQRAVSFYEKLGFKPQQTQMEEIL